MDKFQLATQLISLRPLEPEDLNILYKWENDPEIWTVSDTQTPFSKYILKKYIEESHRDIYDTKQLRLIIEKKPSEIVGAIDLFNFDPFNQRAGIGILIYAHSDRGKGYAADAIQLIKNYTKQFLGLHQLYANIMSSNKASIELFTKLGFNKTVCKKDWNRTLDGWEDEFLFQCLL